MPATAGRAGSSPAPRRRARQTPELRAMLARQHPAVAIDAEAQRHHALLVPRLRACSGSACSAAAAPAAVRASSRWRRGSRRCPGSAPPASPRCSARSAAPPWCAAPACAAGPAGSRPSGCPDSSSGFFSTRLRLRLRQRHLRRRLDLRHRLDHLGLDLFRRRRRRLRLDHVRPRRQIVRRCRRDRQRRELDDHRR